MKRFKVLGLCLVAAFALSALIASAASAALPEYALCVKVPKIEGKYQGKYSVKTCATEATALEQTEGKHNKYERHLGLEGAKKTTIKGKNIGTPKNILVSPIHCSAAIVLGTCTGTYEPGANKPATEAGVTECTKEKVEGNVTSAKNTQWKTVYSKCKGNGDPANTTGSKKAEEITTEELESTLVYTNAAKTAAGLRVKGLGPGGRLAQYEIHALGIEINVYGEVVAETTGNFDSAEGKTKAIVGAGPLNLQKTLYVEETFTEEQGKEFYETVIAFETCEKGESPFPPGTHTHAECEGFGVHFKETQPVMLLSVISGAINSKAPAVQNGTTENKGEKFLIDG